jgi:hypothetical protein
MQNALIQDAHELRYPYAYYDILEKNMEALKDLIEDFERCHVSVQYHYDTENGYTNGHLDIDLYSRAPKNDEPYHDHAETSLGYRYKIEFLYLEEYTGYCQCTPKDEGYIFKRGCCGNGCDWYRPYINVTKIVDYPGIKDFEGMEKDLWRLEDIWNGIEEETAETKKNDEIAYIQRRINELEDRKRRLIER